MRNGMTLLEEHLGNRGIDFGEGSQGRDRR